MPTGDSIDIKFTLVGIDSTDLVPPDYQVYFWGETTEKLHISRREGSSVYFKLAISDVPCEVMVYEDFGYTLTQINQKNNADVKVYFKTHTRNIGTFIPAGITEKYTITDLTRDSFFLSIGYGAYKRH